MELTTKNYFVSSLILLFLFFVATIPFHPQGPGLISRKFDVTVARENHNPNITRFSDKLEEALSRASTKDKTVIITIVNKAYVEQYHDQYPTMFDIFLEGFWVGEETQSLLNHLLVVSMDQTAYDRCIFRRLNCYRLTTKGVDFGEEKLYMSEDFITMMWARTGFLLNVLKRGYNFIFTDTDVIWLRDPFPILKNFNETNDLLISTDRFKGNPRSTKNRINTGFYYVTSNNKTIALFETWYGRRTNSTGMKEQDVLEGLIAEGTATNKLGLTLRFLDTLYFSGFCRNSNDVRKVITVHANCCKTIGAKVSDLTKVIRDWKMFINQYSRDPVAYNISEFKWSVYDACRKSWKLPPPSS